MENISPLLNWLQFQVETIKDLSADQMLEELRRKADLDHNEYDMFACFILSHGGSGGKIYGIDKDFITEQQIRDIFHGTKCLSLRDKPKLFFIQACRGERMDDGTFGKQGLCLVTLDRKLF